VRNWEGWGTLILCGIIVATIALLQVPYRAGAAADSPRSLLTHQPVSYLERRAGAVAFRKEMTAEAQAYADAMQGVLLTAGRGEVDGPAAHRLEQAQASLADTLQRHYPGDAGQRLAALLHADAHLAIAVVAASRPGNQSDLDVARSRWYANAAALTDLLSGDNPAQWSQEQIKPLLYALLDATCAEALDQAKHQPSAAADQDRRTRTQEWTTRLTVGTIHRFPDQFRTGPVER
jgi:hypothetical protein